MPTYWVNTVSLEHVEAAVAGGFTQAHHGTDTGLRRMRPGDEMVFYSPRTAMRSGSPLRRFTALGTVTGDAPYQEKVRPDFRPWRLAVDFQETRHADPGPLLEDLSFITDVASWGTPFRRGLFEIPASDFELIRAAMTPDPA